MGVKIKQMPNFSRLKEQFQREVVAEMQRIALDNREEVITRTGRGLDVNSQSFTAYTPKYAKFKASKGRNGRVDLRFSGRMLQSFQTQVFQRGSKFIARIFPGSNLDALKVQGNMRWREFFAISDKQKQEFRDRMTNVFRRLK